MSAETKSYILPRSFIGTTGNDTVATAIEFCSPFWSNGVWFATEAGRHFIFPNNCVLSRLTVQCTAFVADVNPTVRTRVQGADGNQIVTITGAAIFQDTTNTDAIANLDQFAYEFDHQGGATTALTMRSIGNICEAS